ncbi:hypothetical protein AUEXF2481DRAFT_7063 [Aureobasidium subglaciale EXF-2481]|uniref:EKC/KEOPS complex subunit GON7 n=1 Tax=Aureobasidium subglaciale (strain EXF-2481) TaxID=1043005 RepID=A0A074Y5U0_AURSE|nr:uncharacterized protein AUEXF2481DRAFT_7063 [Aureobasidium subglaciale EXF-2481]KEQ93113.1 hypothetical protein AUEXF2481DRAFT_7063 [Aureobasidium subglaciale EXF-2481]
MSAHLTAVYTSPTATNTFSAPLSVIQMQEDINQYLTKKMDEDKAATEGAANSKDEDLEEQMYGEELVDED